MWATSWSRRGIGWWCWLPWMPRRRRYDAPARRSYANDRGASALCSCSVSLTPSARVTYDTSTPGIARSKLASSPSTLTAPSAPSSRKLACAPSCSSSTGSASDLESPRRRRRSRDADHRQPGAPATCRSAPTPPNRCGNSPAQTTNSSAASRRQRRRSSKTRHGPQPAPHASPPAPRRPQRTRGQARDQKAAKTQKTWRSKDRWEDDTPQRGGSPQCTPRSNTSPGGRSNPVTTPQLPVQP